MADIKSDKWIRQERESKCTQFEGKESKIRWDLRLEVEFAVAAIGRLAELLDIVVLDIVLLRRKNISLPNPRHFFDFEPRRHRKLHGHVVFHIYLLEKIPWRRIRYVDLIRD